MDIEFCDICGESVPNGDVDDGTAKRFGDRLVCKRCDDAMTRHIGPAAAATQGGAAFAAAHDHAGALGHVHGPGHVHGHGLGRADGSGPLWLAAACVAVVALVGYLAVDRVQDAERRVQADVAGQMVHLEDRIAGLEHVLRHSVAPIFEEDRDAPRFDALAARLETIEGRLDDRLDPDLLFAEFEQVSADLRAVSAALGDDAEAGLRATDTRLDAIADDVARLRDDLSLLARSLLEVLEDAPQVAQAPAEIKREAAESQPDWIVFVPSLSSDDEGERWNAVEELGASGDPEAAEHLVPMLRDRELFVRMAAARVLGDLGNELAITPLIDALEDVEPSVRESAVLSLRLLTNRSFGFEPNGEVRDRQRTSKKWRDWWEGEGAGG